MLGMIRGRTLRHSQRRGTLSLLCADRNQVELLLTGYPVAHFISYVKLGADHLTLEGGGG